MNIGNAIGLGERLAAQAIRNEQSKATLKADTRFMPHGGVAKAPVVPPEEERLVKPRKREVVIVNRATAAAQGQPDSLARNIKEINGARVLDMVVAGLRNYLRFEAEEHIWAIALWIMHTWLTDEDGTLITPFSPRLFLWAESGAGKTRAMRIIARLAHEAVGPVSGVVSAPGVREALTKHRTVLLDEVHRYIRNPNLQGIVNQYTPEGGSLNGRGGLNAQGQYGPVALAGIKKYLLDSRLSEVIDDLFTRCIKIEMKKHADEDDPIPPLDAAFDKGAAVAAAAMALWGAQLRPGDPDEKVWNLGPLPDGLKGRNWEISVPLAAVGDRAVDTRVSYYLDEVDPSADPGIVVPMTEEYAHRWADMARRACLYVITGEGQAQRINNDIENMIGGWAR